MTAKRALGQYFTRRNPFALRPFQDWARLIDWQRECVLEPFAGENGLIKFLNEIKSPKYKYGLARRFRSYDIAPQDADVDQRDTLRDFPRGHDVCVTNPPWLAKNSAKRRNIPYYGGNYDDVYKYAVDRCLAHCGFAAIILPESYIRTGLFLDRLHSFISLTDKTFEDTNHPVGMALFTPASNKDILIYRDNEFLGTLADIKRKYPLGKARKPIIFNQPGGNLGLFALDNCRTASIRFCDPKELAKYDITHSSRALTIIKTYYKPDIEAYNTLLNDFRSETRDVLMTPYRGLRKDGQYRRRLDWNLAKAIIAKIGESDERTN